MIVLGACSSGAEVASSDEPTDVAVTAEVAEVIEEAEVEAAPTPDTAPAIEAGGVAQGTVEINGVAIDYVTSTPDGFEIGNDAPLLLAFPPGPQDLGLTQSIVQGTYNAEAQRLGWVVISPAATDEGLYFQGSEELVPGLLDWVETWVTPEGGAPHVAGISNGGISAFRYSALNPDRVQSLITFPGFARSSEDQAALSELADIPVRLFVGGLDTGWISPAEEAVASLTGFGGDAELTVFEGEGHVMDSTRDGTVVFEQLEDFRVQ